MTWQSKLLYFDLTSKQQRPVQRALDLMANFRSISPSISSNARRPAVENFEHGVQSAAAAIVRQVGWFPLFLGWGHSGWHLIG